jgi:hypothetical protein
MREEDDNNQTRKKDENVSRKEHSTVSHRAKKTSELVDR